MALTARSVLSCPHSAKIDGATSEEDSKKHVKTVWVFESAHCVQSVSLLQSWFVVPLQFKSNNTYKSTETLAVCCCVHEATRTDRTSTWRTYRKASKCVGDRGWRSRCRSWSAECKLVLRRFRVSVVEHGGVIECRRRVAACLSSLLHRKTPCCSAMRY